MHTSGIIYNESLSRAIETALTEADDENQGKCAAG
jgi:hypothetical protein